VLGNAQSDAVDVYSVLCAGNQGEAGCFVSRGRPITGDKMLRDGALPERVLAGLAGGVLVFGEAVYAVDILTVCVCGGGGGECSLVGVEGVKGPDVALLLDCGSWGQLDDVLFPAWEASRCTFLRRTTPERFAGWRETTEVSRGQVGTHSVEDKQPLVLARIANIGRRLYAPPPSLLRSCLDACVGVRCAGYLVCCMLGALMCRAVDLRVMQAVERRGASV
jgi:hypothetical protein